MTCEITNYVWHKIFSWLGWCLYLANDLTNLFQMFYPLGGVYRIMGAFMTWHAVVWSLWKSHNDIVFLDESVKWMYVIVSMKSISTC